MLHTRKIVISSAPSPLRGEGKINKTCKKRQVKKGCVKKRKKLSVSDVIRKGLSAEDARTRWKQYAPELLKLNVKPTDDVFKNVKYKPRVTKLLDSLNGDVTWDSDGTASVKGKEIPYSHIADLVEAYFEPTKARPLGWDSFKRILPKHGETKDSSVQWEEWPSKHTPKPRKVKSGRKT